MYTPLVALHGVSKAFGPTKANRDISLEIARGYCDRLIGMANGRVVFDGAPDELTDAVARELYGMEAKESAGDARQDAPAGAAEPAAA